MIIIIIIMIIPWSAVRPREGILETGGPRGILMVQPRPKGRQCILGPRYFRRFNGVWGCIVCLLSLGPGESVCISGVASRERAAAVGFLSYVHLIALVVVAVQEA